jgi:hypothetical protein
MRTIEQVIEYLENRIKANEQTIEHMCFKYGVKFRTEIANMEFQEVLDFIRKKELKDENHTS